MKKTRSIQASVRLFCIYFSVFCFLVLFAISFFLIRRNMQEGLEAAKNELGSYITAFENEVNVQASFNRDYIANDSNVDVLSLNRYPGPSRFSHVYNVSQVLSRRASRFCISIMYDRKTDQIFTTPLPFPSVKRNLDDSVVLRALVSFSDSLESSRHNTWNLFSYNDTNYLIFCNQKNRLLLTTVFSLEDYFVSLPHLNGNNNSRIILTDDASILAGDPTGLDDAALDFVVSASQKPDTLSTSSKRLVFSQDINLPGLDLHLCQLLTINDYFRDSVSILIVFFVLLGILLGFAALANRYLMRFLVFPLQEIQTLSKLAEENQPFIPAQTELPIEYEEIRSSLYALAEKLEKEQRERQAYISQKEHALLQYYQLQTRSHFFINCLKSLYSMLELRRVEQMKEMIIAFSSHLRNTFRDSLQLIPLSLELDEVAAYHTILFLDDTRPILLNASVPEALKDIMVPPLVIQSFLENTYKHGKPGDSLIMFTIQADTVLENGKEYLQLRLSDNGSGYSKERLFELNTPPSGSFDTNNVGINNLKRRINILFHGEGRTAFVNQPSGGACAIISFPAVRSKDKEGEPQ